MRFLDGPATRLRLKKLLNDATKVRAAVAYWGIGAVDQLGLNELTKRDVRIYCDVRSGGCDVTEVKLLLKHLGSGSVRTCDKLHAKAWLTESACVIGSSNASTNGHGVEGSAAAKLLEANVYFEDPKVMERLEEWIDNDVHLSSRAIDDDDLIEGDKNRPSRVGSAVSRLTVLDQVERDSNAYKGRNVFVWIWPFKDMTAKEEAAVEAEGRSRGISDITAWIGATRTEIKRLQPGSLVLEFDSSSSPPRFEAVFRVLTDDPVCQIQGQTSLLCSDVGTVFGAPIGNRKRWRGAVERAILNRPNRTLLVSLHEFTRDYLL